jgi:hypothetical protein
LSDFFLASVGLRLNKELERAIDDVKNEESVDKSTAVRMLVDSGYRQWKYRRALEKLRKNKITLWEAARIAGMPLWDFSAELKKEEGIEWAEFDSNDKLSPPRRRRTKK